jgi:CubicO group peptidase (beta-lactamase class C family)
MNPGFYSESMSTKKSPYLVLLSFILVTGCVSSSENIQNIQNLRLPITKPELVGISGEKLGDSFELIEAWVDSNKIPGAVALVGRKGKIVGFESFGYAQLIPSKVKMERNTLFDLASLTKPIATASSIMILVERGKIRLDDKVSFFIPEFSQGSKDEVTVRHLLTHTSGLPAWEPIYVNSSGDDYAIDYICGVKLENAPGNKYVYSDLGYILLGEVIERVSGQKLDKFAEENIFAPLGMKNTMFNPPDGMKERCAATEYCAWRKEIIRGKVHDENAYSMGGVSGHAGLFSTAGDLSTFCEMMLEGGSYQGERILSPHSVQIMTSNQIEGLGNYGFGWATRSDDYCSCGDFMSEKAFGHTGFTGTSIWIDPEEDVFIILLTNRVHPSRENQNHIRLRPLFANAVMSSIQL